MSQLKDEDNNMETNFRANVHEDVLLQLEQQRQQRPNEDTSSTYQPMSFQQPSENID